jgi:hypothetical protein
VITGFRDLLQQSDQSNPLNFTAGTSLRLLLKRCTDSANQETIVSAMLAINVCLLYAKVQM